MIQPILDFELYCNAIVNIIKKSYQNLLLELENGGTGKTTLMKSLEKEFDKDKENIISVWFDAWKYENEKEFALTPITKDN